MLLASNYQKSYLVRIHYLIVEVSSKYSIHPWSLIIIN